MTWKLAFRLVVITTAIGSGCGKPPTVEKLENREDTLTTKTFELKGIVRRVDASTGEVTITHETIDGVMPRMTMPFLLDDHTILEDIQVGDEVSGPLKVEFRKDEVKDLHLLGLSVTRPSTGLQPENDQAPKFLAATLKPGEVVPDFTVTTQDGNPLRLSQWQGKVVILTFIYTRCPKPEFCPAIDAKFAELARRISAVPGRSEQFRLLSISFDPVHDTPSVLQAHAARRGAKPPLWTFAVASFEELHRVGSSLGLSFIPGTSEIEHNLRTAIIGPDGRLVRLEVGGGWEPSSLLKVAFPLARTVRE